ncbi:MAG TPA: hypothetical protein VFG56_00400 [Candidatus Saccharimonadales bacterium]|nr:hypothetical protein [Candidatus Saccharimonadales bacterium]
MLKIKRPKPIRQISSGLMIVSVGFISSFLALSYMGYGLDNQTGDNGHVLGSSTSQSSDDNGDSSDVTNADKSSSSDSSTPPKADKPKASSTATPTSWSGQAGRGGGGSGGSSSSTSIDPAGYTVTVSPSPTGGSSTGSLPISPSHSSDGGGTSSSSGGSLTDPVTDTLKTTTDKADKTLEAAKDTTGSLLGG